MKGQGRCPCQGHRDEIPNSLPDTGGSMQFSREQQAAIAAKNRELLVSAAAGSGKTAVLIEKIYTMLRDEGIERGSHAGGHVHARRGGGNARPPEAAHGGRYRAAPAAASASGWSLRTSPRCTASATRWCRSISRRWTSIPCPRWRTRRWPANLFQEALDEAMDAAVRAGGGRRRGGQGADGEVRGQADRQDGSELYPF